MAADVRLNVDTTGTVHARSEVDHLDRRLKNLESTGRTLQRAGKSAFGGYHIGAIAAAVSVAALTRTVISFGKTAVTAAMDMQKTQAALAVAVKNSGLSWAGHRVELEKAVVATRNLSGFTDTELKKSLGRFIVATKDSKKSITDMNLAVDLARGAHLGLDRATLLVTKTQIGMVSGLKRIGIMVPGITKGMTDQQKAVIGLAYLHQRFSGQAATFGNTAAGGFARASASWEAMKVTIGQAALPALGHLASYLDKNVIPKLQVAAEEIKRIFNDPKLTGEQKWQKSWDAIAKTGLPHKAREAILQGFTWVGKNAPGAILKAMADAPWQGQAVIGALLLKKFGPAFAILGKGLLGAGAGIAGMGSRGGIVGGIASSLKPIDVFVVNQGFGGVSGKPGGFLGRAGGFGIGGGNTMDEAVTAAVGLEVAKVGLGTRLASRIPVIGNLARGVGTGGALSGEAGAVAGIQAAGLASAGAITAAGVAAIAGVVGVGLAVNKLAETGHLGVFGRMFPSKADYAKQSAEFTNNLVLAARGGGESFKKEWTHLNPFDLSHQGDKAIGDVTSFMANIRNAIAAGGVKKEWAGVVAGSMNQLKGMGPTARAIAEDSMVQMAAGLEAKGTLPKGSTKRLMAKFTTAFGELPKATKDAAARAIPTLEGIDKILRLLGIHAGTVVTNVGKIASPGTMVVGGHHVAGPAKGARLPGTYTGKDNMLIPAATGEWVLTPNQVRLADRGMSVYDAVRSTGGNVGHAQRGGYVAGGVVSAISNAASRYGVDAAAMGAVGMVESGLRANAVGDGGLAIGLFQEHPQYGSVAQRSDPVFASMAAARGLAGAGGRGVFGAHAVRLMVTGFERPANPSAEISAALGHLPAMQNLFGKGSKTGVQGVPPTKAAIAAAGARAIRGFGPAHAVITNKKDVQGLGTDAGIAAEQAIMGDSSLTASQKAAAIQTAQRDATRNAEVAYYNGEHTLTLARRKVVQKEIHALTLKIKKAALHLPARNPGHATAIAGINAMKKRRQALVDERTGLNQWLQEINQALLELGRQAKQDSIDDQLAAGLAAEQAASTGSSAATSGPTADQQAALDQANLATATAQAGLKAADQFIATAFGPGDFGQGAPTAWQAAGGVFSPTFQFLTLGDPMVAQKVIAEIARAANTLGARSNPSVDLGL